MQPHNIAIPTLGRCATQSTLHRRFFFFQFWRPDIRSWIDPSQFANQTDPHQTLSDIHTATIDVVRALVMHWPCVPCRHIAREEGLMALQKGLGPSLLREASYSSIRLSLYEPLRNMILTEYVNMPCFSGLALSETVLVFLSVLPLLNRSVTLWQTV